MTIRGVLGRAALVLAAGATMLAVTAGTSRAAPARATDAQPALGTCTPKTGVSVHDPYGHGFSRLTTCRNGANAPVYAATNTGFLKGHLVTTSSFFLCWRPGDLNSGGPFGDSLDWYYTQGDTHVPGASNSWGFVPGTFIDTTDPAVGIPECTYTSVPH